ncbi:MAG: hypothetical protein M1825_000389 [Sarcosagium campestre]|nr:MAG: hypothetical protein M1825_000389 [Sarcosagium campestre]
MANPSQLFLLADHIKLSLLERQRAISLNLEPNSQDGHISRSLDSFREGLDAIETERIRLESTDATASSELQDQELRLRKQFDDLTSQFHGFAPTNSTTTQPNDPSLNDDFSHAKSGAERPRNPSSSSFLKRSAVSSKSVRFSDSPAAAAAQTAGSPTEDANRAALFPYRDDPDDSTAPDHTHLDNQQIHAYHSEVLQQQDDQLDRLGESIGRQRELSIQIGDELESHVQLLDEVDEHVDRHQTRLDGARKRLGVIARRAKDNLQLTIILILICILILLIIILK